MRILLQYIVTNKSIILKTNAEIYKTLIKNQAYLIFLTPLS